jgi:hypothetical protein
VKKLLLLMVRVQGLLWVAVVVVVLKRLLYAVVPDSVVGGRGDARRGQGGEKWLDIVA